MRSNPVDIDKQDILTNFHETTNETNLKNTIMQHNQSNNNHTSKMNSNTSDIHTSYDHKKQGLHFTDEQNIAIKNMCKDYVGQSTVHFDSISKDDNPTSVNVSDNNIKKLHNAH